MLPGAAPVPPARSPEQPRLPPRAPAGLPLPLRKPQCDNGKEFPFAFALSVREAGIEHRYIEPRPPQHNGKAERSHRIDAEEFWRRGRFRSFAEATAALREWERTYNHERFSLALARGTPAEKLAEVLEAA